jgi:2-oxoisovalerate dehydrogenase E1 component
MGKKGGFTNGRDRTFHFGMPEKRIVGMISQVGAMLPVACGLGLSCLLDGSSDLALVFTGEGATREGDFHEALNLASIWRLPVVFVVENNGYGLSTPVAEAIPVEDIATAAEGYGMAGAVVDGNDILDVVANVRKAAERAREGSGPTLLEMKTFRMRGHEEASGNKYVPRDLIEAWSQKDPVDRFRKYVIEQGILSETEIDQIETELVSVVDEAADYALAADEVTSDLERERNSIFATTTTKPRPLPPLARSRELRFVDALSDGLRLAMEEDDRTVLLGQDIAEYGGVFKVSQGFLEQFGSDRIRNTPIIESGAIGAAMGMALGGYIPIVEIQYADFLACGFNQIVNNLATTHYRWGAPLPVTIRAPFGGYIGAGPFHSQSPEAWFCHVPGLKVVVPGSPFDAKGLIGSAIKDPNPVLFLEHKLLYRSTKEEVPDCGYDIPLGEAQIVLEGESATVVTYGIGVSWAEEEAEYLESFGVSLEIVNLRTLIPWDRSTVKKSLRKTGRLLVLQEAPRTAGFGAEITSQIVEEAFEYLDAPPIRVAAEDWPIPFSPYLEKKLYSARSSLREGLKILLEY